MYQHYDKLKSRLWYRFAVCVFSISFALSGIVLPTGAYAQTILNLPPAGTMVMPTTGFVPPMLKGLKIHPDNPLQFDFIMDTGYSPADTLDVEAEASKLIRYFLASLTTPEEDLWVNLSPNEPDRIIPESFGQTEMGRDLLAQDYLLKQLTASLMYPERELGQSFWNKIHAQAYALYGTTDIPVNTFNKVWIVPERAVVYESEDVVYVMESRLKVLLEEDYVSYRQAMISGEQWTEENQSGSQPQVTEVIRNILIPAIEKEVNEGENFANLRQIYHSMILATWFKRYFAESILGQAYAGQNKITGIDLEDKAIKHKIYNQYLEAFKTGVYNYIKEEYDPATQEIIPRKYFSGGAMGFASNPQALERRVVDKADLFLAAKERKIGTSLKTTVRFDAVQQDKSKIKISDVMELNLGSEERPNEVRKLLAEIHEAWDRENWDVIRQNLLYLIDIYQEEEKGDVVDRLEVDEGRFDRYVVEGIVPDLTGRLAAQRSVLKVSKASKSGITAVVQGGAKAYKLSINPGQGHDPSVYSALRKAKTKAEQGNIVETMRLMFLAYDKVDSKAPLKEEVFKTIIFLDNELGNEFEISLNREPDRYKRLRLLMARFNMQHTPYLHSQDYHNLLDRVKLFTTEYIDKLNEDDSAFVRRLIDPKVNQWRKEWLKQLQDEAAQEARKSQEVQDLWLSKIKRHRLLLDLDRHDIGILSVFTRLRNDGINITLERVGRRHNIFSDGKLQPGLGLDLKEENEKAIELIIEQKLKPFFEGSFDFSMLPQEKAYQDEDVLLSALDKVQVEAIINSPHVNELADLVNEIVRLTGADRQKIRDRLGKDDIGIKSDSDFNRIKHPDGPPQELEQLTIGEYKVMFVNSKWVDPDLFVSERNRLISGIEKFVKDPENSTYAIGGKIKRIAQGRYRLYLRMHEAEKTIVVVAFGPTQDTKSSSDTSALDRTFKNEYLTNLDQVSSLPDYHNGYSIKPVMVKKETVDRAEVSGGTGDRAMVGTDNAYDFKEEPWFKDGHTSNLYHSLEHSINVATMARDLALARGRSDELARFLYQVGLLHDFDPQRPLNTRPRVSATLKLLEDDFNRKKSLDGQQGSFLQDRFGWDEEKYFMALAIIQRSEYPFTSEHPGLASEERSPVDKYISFLKKLQSEAIEQTMMEAAIFSEYADKMNWMAITGFAELLKKTEGLFVELVQEGGASDRNPTIFEYASRLGSRSNLQEDEKIAESFGLTIPFPEREVMVSQMPGKYKSRFMANFAGIQEMRRLKETNAIMSDDALAEQGRQAAEREWKKVSERSEVFTEEHRKILDSIPVESQLKMLLLQFLSHIQESGYESLIQWPEDWQFRIEDVSMDDLPHPKGPNIGVIPRMVPGLELAPVWSARGVVDANFLLVFPYNGIFHGRENEKHLFVQHAVFVNKDNRLVLGRFKKPVPLHAITPGGVQDSTTRRALRDIGIPIDSETEALDLFNHKEELTRVLQKTGAQVIKTIAFKNFDMDAILKAIQSLSGEDGTGDVVIKPIISGGRGDGTLIFTQENQMLAIAHAKRLLDQGREILIQERIQNDLWTRDGKKVDWNLRVYQFWDGDQVVVNEDLIYVRYNPDNFKDISQPVASKHYMLLKDLFRELKFTDEQKQQFLQGIRDEISKVIIPKERDIKEQIGERVSGAKATALVGWDLMMGKNGAWHIVEANVGFVGGLGTVMEKEAPLPDKGKALLPLMQYFKSIASEYQRAQGGFDDTLGKPLAFPEEDPEIVLRLIELTTRAQESIISDALARLGIEKSPTRNGYVEALKAEVARLAPLLAKQKGNKESGPDRSEVAYEQPQLFEDSVAEVLRVIKRADLADRQSLEGALKEFKTNQAEPFVKAREILQELIKKLPQKRIVDEKGNLLQEDAPEEAIDYSRALGVMLDVWRLHQKGVDYDIRYKSAVGKKVHVPARGDFPAYDSIEFIKDEIIRVTPRIRASVKTPKPSLISVSHDRSSVMFVNAEEVAERIRTRLRNARRYKMLEDFNAVYNHPDMSDEAFPLIEEFLDTPGIEQAISTMRSRLMSAHDQIESSITELYHASQLVQAGYKVLALNYIHKRADGASAFEIDLILKDKNGKYIIGEVKHYPGRRHHVQYNADDFNGALKQWVFSALGNSRTSNFSNRYRSMFRAFRSNRDESHAQLAQVIGEDEAAAFIDQVKRNEDRVLFSVPRTVGMLLTADWNHVVLGPDQIIDLKPQWLTGEKLPMGGRYALGQIEKIIEYFLWMRAGVKAALFTPPFKAFNLTANMSPQYEIPVERDLDFRGGMPENDDLGASSGRVGRVGRERAEVVDESKDLGGIDLNPANLAIEAQGQGMNVGPAFDPAQLPNIRFDGLVPVIINITPTNLPLLLGIEDRTPTKQLTRL